MARKEKELSWIEEIKILEREMEELKKEKKDYETKIKQLRLKEDPDNGIFFHQEIFMSQQKKLALEVELEFKKKKKNRILLAHDQLKLF